MLGVCCRAFLDDLRDSSFVMAGHEAPDGRILICHDAASLRTSALAQSRGEELEFR
jgi:hypothetical protein